MFLRETSALVEAMRYFKLKESKIIVAEGDGKKINKQGLIYKLYRFTNGRLKEHPAPLSKDNKEILITVPRIFAIPKMIYERI